LPDAKLMTVELLEYNAIFVFYRWVLELTVCSAVTGAVVLNLDDNASQFTTREVQDIFDNRCVLALPANITYQHRQSAACF